MENKMMLESTTVVSDAQKEELLIISNHIEKLENSLKQYNDIKIEYDDFRKKLFEAMTKFNVTKFVSEGGIQFTVTAQGDDKTKITLKFDEETFKEEHPDLYKKYITQVETVTKGRASHLRITVPKEK